MILGRPSPRYRNLLVRSHFYTENKKNDLFYFETGREALVSGLQRLNLPSGSKVLIPAYICESICNTLTEAGYEIEFIDIEENLSIDLVKLEKILNESNISSILVPHYFGFPVDLDPIKKLCERFGIYLIEDCAHSFLSKYKGKSLGDTGDIAIFSMRKSLPVFDGGALKINGKENLKSAACNQTNMF